MQSRTTFRADQHHSDIRHRKQLHGCKNCRHWKYWHQLLHFVRQRQPRGYVWLAHVIHKLTIRNTLKYKTHLTKNNHKHHGTSTKLRDPARPQSLSVIGGMLDHGLKLGEIWHSYTWTRNVLFITIVHSRQSRAGAAFFLFRIVRIFTVPIPPCSLLNFSHTLRDITETEIYVIH